MAVGGRCIVCEHEGMDGLKRNFFFSLKRCKCAHRSEESSENSLVFDSRREIVPDGANSLKKSMIMGTSEHPGCLFF